MWLTAIALAMAPRAAHAQQSPPAGDDGNPLRQPAPASELEISEPTLPSPIENSPAMQFASGLQMAPARGGAELLPRPAGPEWQGEQPDWIQHGTAPLDESELAPEALSGEPALQGFPAPLANSYGKAYPPAFKAPLTRESWMFRPFHVDGFAGTLLAANPIKNRVDAGAGFYIGFRLGWDMSKHFGTETSFGFCKVGNTYVNLPFKMGDEKLFLWDASWLWYPWGDTRFRPYLILGTGLYDIHFVNEINQVVHSTLFQFPWGGGFKYRFGNRLALRFDVRDNIGYGAGDGLGVMHNLSLTANMEWHFGGGPKRSYWPWNPGRNWW
jgi:hypothetical protein